MRRVPQWRPGRTDCRNRLGRQVSCELRPDNNRERLSHAEADSRKGGHAQLLPQLHTAVDSGSRASLVRMVNSSPSFLQIRSTGRRRVGRGLQGLGAQALDIGRNHDFLPTIPQHTTRSRGTSRETEAARGGCGERTTLGTGEGAPGIGRRETSRREKGIADRARRPATSARTCWG